MRYVGKCPDHGLIQHEADKKTLATKTEPYCPFCGKYVEVIKMVKKGNKEK